MGLIYENLKNCALKITAKIGYVPITGSGIIYQTPNYYDYNYVLTAKHLLSEDSKTEFDIGKLNSIKFEYFKDGEFAQLAYLNGKQLEINSNIILFESQDLVIIKIEKLKGLNFPSILVTDYLDDDELIFSSWSIFKANFDSFDHFKFDRSDPSSRRIKLNEKVDKDYLNGLSGSGVFVHNKNILYGIISKYTNENFQNATIECSNISFGSVNAKLITLNLLPLDDKYDQFFKKEMNGKIVEIYQAQINGAYLDLNLSLKRVEADMSDDWFYDPLQYIDLLNTDYLFSQFEKYFYNNKYKAFEAERFYVPKSNFTLREAYVMPLRDRIIYMALVGELAEIIENSLIPNIFASRFNRINKESLLLNGVEQWKKLKYKIAEELGKKESNGDFKYDCILQVDILNYYDNIDKKLLIEKLKRSAVTQNQLKCIGFLEEFLNTYSQKSKGLPQNNEASALLATFYLNQVDLYMQNHTLSYYRFVDDITILCVDKYEARRYLTLLEKELKRCHLSMNSQKTKIIELKSDEKQHDLEDSMSRDFYSKIFNLELEKIKNLSKSVNYQNRNDAFHLAVKLLNDNINVDENEKDDSSQNLRFSLNVIEYLGKSKIHFLSDTSDLFRSLSQAVKALKDKPWITYQICKILSLTELEDFKNFFLDDLKMLVLERKYSIYPYQQFQVWLLLAKQKIEDNDLIQFASSKIEINDKTKVATTAAQIIYLSTVDKNYNRIILRKIEENFTDGYFQNRAALIALRSFQLIKPSKESMHPSLQESFEFTSKYGEKDLVYYHDLDLSESNTTNLDQLFSL